MELYFPDLCALCVGVSFDCRFRVQSHLCSSGCWPTGIFSPLLHALIRLKSDRSNLLSVTLIAVEEQSQPIQFLPSLCATTNVVPEPQKKSATRSLVLENCPIILSNNCSCFSVS